MNIKRILALLLAAALLGSLPALAEGGEEPAPDDLFLLGDSSEYGEVDILDDPYDDGEDFAYIPEESIYGDEDVWDDIQVMPVQEEDQFYSEDALYAAITEEDQFYSEDALYAGITADGGGNLYDPRGSSYLLSVRNQGSWNTCWAVAAMTAAEWEALCDGCGRCA